MIEDEFLSRISRKTNHVFTGKSVLMSHESKKVVLNYVRCLCTVETAETDLNQSGI